MDVFIRGVPERTTSNQLSSGLRPSLLTLNIHDWRVHKVKGKNFASLTFLHPSDGQAFLDKHGSVSTSIGRPQLPYGRIQLLFKGTALSCTKSNRQPDPFALRSLKLESKARKAKALSSTPAEKPIVQEQSAQQQGLKKPSGLSVSMFSCGLWDLVNVSPTYVYYQSWSQTGTLKFTSKGIAVKLQNRLVIEFSANILHEIVFSKYKNSDLILTGKEPPRFFYNTATANRQLQLNEFMSGLNLHKQGTGPDLMRIPCLDGNHATISGSCLVYIFRFADDHVSSGLQNVTSIRALPPIIWQRVQIIQSPVPFQTQLSRLFKSMESPPLPFPIKFQVIRLAQEGCLPPKTVSAILPEIRALARRSGQAICSTVVRRLFQNLSWRCLEDDASYWNPPKLKALLLEKEFQIKAGEASEDEFIDSESLVNVHRVTITPAGMILAGPTPENNNRVLRKYSQHHNNFLRVQFSDEDSEPLRFNARASNQVIYNDRFKKILNEGFTLAGQHFSFLGFSHSSLRAQSCWFMAPFVHDGRLLFDRELIKGLGDFSNIRCPAKCAARIGQAFSETPTAVTLEAGVCKEIPDVARNGRVFSDGVGTMSPSVMKLIWNHLPVHKTRPTLFQIRYGGAKGMISLDTRLKGDVLNLRPSMMKFPGSTSTDIELCTGSYRALPYYLNHQSIKILEDMGVADDFFLDNQTKEIERLRKTTADSKMASKFLKKHAIGERINLPWFIQKLDRMDVDFRDDPFLRDIVEIAVLIELRALKYKARIPIELGYTLLGIMDETGYLNEGEIFCIVDDKSGPSIIVGSNLLVTRSPALHPGDVQIVRGVNVPHDSPLLSLRNCICFSQKGPRDLPSMLSGGDLDGDLYQILFDPQARPRRSYIPADYPRAKPVDLGRPVDRADMTDFFVTFMATDQLGRISNNHKIRADQCPEGTLHGDCLTLAEMASVAVDFSKSGIPVDLSRMPKIPPYRPDFMAFGPHTVIHKDKPVSFSDIPRNDPNPLDDEEEEDDGPQYQFYESTQILGKLFRRIDERDVLQSIQQPKLPLIKSRDTVIQAIRNYVVKFCSHIDLTSHVTRAYGIQDEYEEMIQNLCWEFSPSRTKPLSEREVFIGNILGRDGAQTKRQHDLSLSLRDQVNTAMTYIVNRIIKDGYEESEDSLERSIACFLISVKSLDDSQDGRGRGEKLISFCYVAAAVCLREIEKSQSRSHADHESDLKFPPDIPFSDTWMRQYGNA
ncbi:hypothetical protein PV10_05059 [Exophiala mesophila]|uniref:RNA-dependent RNA polymerase n=1 Tax=Exophiala mesophila TaxID=212818 RepID=A0A0D1WWW0_EXOME|nr:uncharacterized protein PV10_05059 [Exophiala mesophila]KIV93880.1 hypothetical protein PV10_05059 [Exophiala mesophila]